MEQFSNNKLFTNVLLVLAIILGGLFILLSTTKAIFETPYKRDAEVMDLGEVRYLLNPMTFLRDKSLLVFFNEKKGWSVMNMRSSVKGCDLSMQASDLYDPCSRSYFRFDGTPAKGAAKYPLPFYKLYYENYKSPNGEININFKRHLLVDVGEIVKPEERFFAPSGTGGSILEAIPKLKELNKLQGVDMAAEVPQILRGGSDGEKGTQFTDSDTIDYGYRK